MGEIKTYMVVTNDEYEHIVKADLKGAKSAAGTDGERNLNTR